MSRAEPTVFERLAPRAEAVDHMVQDVMSACFWGEDPRVQALPELAQMSTLGPTARRADLIVVGGGYAGLWTAIRAKEREPERRVVLFEALVLGWAASGRNGGFCAASLTHGEENGRARWPEEYDALERLGRENLDGIEQTVRAHRMDVDWERSGELSVATEPHQVAWLREAAASGSGSFLDQDQVRAEVASPTYLAGMQSDDCALVHPMKLVRELTRVALELGVQIFDRTHVTGLRRGRAGGPVEVRTELGTLAADSVALCTNAFPALLRRWRPLTVPVWDYAVMTEPLTAEQRAEIGWQGRQGLADLANQFHYYRLTADDRILFGGYDAIYSGKRLDHAASARRPETTRRLASHLLTTFPQLEGIRVTHQWGGAIDTSTRFCAFYDTAMGGRVAHTAGFTGLGVGATRFAADVLLDLLAGEETERTSLEMVRRKPVPFPPEPVASAGIHATRWALDRADHRQGRRNLWLRTLDRMGLGFDS